MGDTVERTPLHRAAAAVWTVRQTLTIALRRSSTEVVASHQTALRLHGIEPALPDRREHVTTVRKLRLLRRRLRVHPHPLGDDEVVKVAGIPLTSLLRTLLDLLLVGDRLTAVWACEQAVAQDLVTLPELRAYLAVPRCFPGIERARSWLELVDPASESPLETAARLMFHDASLPRPAVQHPVIRANGRSFRLDLAYPDRMVAVELDGARYHSTPEQRRRDELRTAELRDLGWFLLRFGWQEVIEHPGDVLATVRATLDHRSGKANPAGARPP